MIDRASRTRYATILRQLASGAMTTDEFSCEAAILAVDSDDPLLVEIHGFADSLFHDLWSYRLRGRHALDRTARATVARLVLMLRTSDAELTAPRPDVLECGPFGLVHLLTMFAAIAATVWLGAVSGALGLALGVGGIAAVLYWLHRHEASWSRRHAARVWDGAVWPFRDRSHLRLAARTPIFLSGPDPKPKPGFPGHFA